MPLKWRLCSGWLGYVRRVANVGAIAADMREQSAETAKRNAKTQRKDARLQRRKDF